MTRKNGRTREDIHYSWMDIIASAQAEASKNGGWGILTISVVLQGKTPYSWVQPELRKMHPMKLTQPGKEQEAGVVVTAYLVNKDHDG